MENTQHNQYEVMRHGGRRTDKPRTVWSGNDRAEAEAMFHKHHLKFRQGGIVLLDNVNKKIIHEDRVGCWRTIPGL